MTLQEQAILLDFINANQPFNFMGTDRYSTLIAGLRDCRAYTKREVNSGTYDPNIPFGDVGNWLAAIGYFSILDQIGSCFKPIGTHEPPATITSIKFSIESFGDDLIHSSSRELHALLALRNAFTHDFNLLNIPRNSRLIPLEQHKFTVVADTTNNWIITLPNRLWNGDIDSKDFFDTSDSTFINLFGITSMVETIFSRVVSSVYSNQVELRIPLLRLINKYTFVTSEHPIK